MVAAYVLISGAGPAAIRSALMAGAAMLAVVGRTTHRSRADARACRGADARSRPQLVEDPGFQLSFLGTAGILLLAAPIASRSPGPRLIAEPFAVTVAAQLATIPIMAGTFGVISLGGPIANALVLPLLPAMIVVGGAGAILSALHPALGWALLQLAGLGHLGHRPTVARRRHRHPRRGHPGRQLAGGVVDRGGVSAWSPRSRRSR